MNHKTQTKSKLILMMIVLSSTLFTAFLFSTRMDLSGIKQYNDEPELLVLSDYTETKEIKEKRQIETPEIPFEFVISSNKVVYVADESIVINVEFIYTGNDIISFAGLDYPFCEWALVNISRKINEKEVSKIGLRCFTRQTSPTANGYIVLRKGETYSLSFQINSKYEQYPGDDIFSKEGVYYFSLDLPTRIGVNTDGKGNYTDQYIWQSNEIEFEVVEEK